MGNQQATLKGDLTRCTGLLSGDNEEATMHRKRSGSLGEFAYQEGDVDVFAIYVLDKDLCLYVNATNFLRGATLAIRLEPARNGQRLGVNDVRQYMDFKRALRGHTQPALTETAEGEEMVQTTTSQDGR